MDNIVSQSTTHLTTSQLIFLERHRRLRQQNGLLPEREWYRAPFKFDPVEADTSEYHVKLLMTRVEAASALGMASQDIQPLVEAGFIRSFSSIVGDGPLCRVFHRRLAC